MNQYKMAQWTKNIDLAGGLKWNFVAITSSNNIIRYQTVSTIHIIRTFIIASLFGFTAIHCAQDNPVSSPVPEITQGLQLVQLPHGPDMKKETSVSASISAVWGGEILLKYSERGDKRSKKILEVVNQIRFDKYSVSCDFVASLSMDTYYLMPELGMEFGPHGTTFLKPATVEVYASGLDLSWVPDGETLKLYYCSNGIWEEIPGDVRIDKNIGSLECLNGKLPHFSRYAFGRLAAY